MAADEGDGPGRAAPNQQRPQQAGAGGIRHTDYRLRPTAGLLEDRLHEGQQATHVVTRGELRHYPAVFRMQGYLGMKGVREQAVVGVKDRHTRLVAGSFDAQYTHKGMIIAPHGLIPHNAGWHSVNDAFRLAGPGLPQRFPGQHNHSYR